MTTGPYQTEAQARETAAVQEIYAAFRAGPGLGRMAPHTSAKLVDACVMAGVDLGAFDRLVLSWLSGWEPETAAVIAGLISRAHESGRARRPQPCPEERPRRASSPPAQARYQKRQDHPDHGQ